MKLHEIAITVILIGLITLGVTTYITDLGTMNGETADLSSMNRTVTSMNNVVDDANNTMTDITNIKLSLNPVDLLSIPYKMIRVGWSGLKTIFGSWTVVQSIGQDVTTTTTDELGIPVPNWLLASAVAIMLIVIVAAIIYGFYKWKFED